MLQEQEFLDMVQIIGKWKLVVLLYWCNASNPHVINTTGQVGSTTTAVLQTTTRVVFFVQVAKPLLIIKHGGILKLFELCGFKMLRLYSILQQYNS